MKHLKILWPVFVLMTQAWAGKDVVKYKLAKAENIRMMSEEGYLVKVFEEKLPKGSVVEVSEKVVPKNLLYESESGYVSMSKNYFLSEVKVRSKSLS